ncbi:MAG: LptA/OstA family protein [bacterium]
MKLSTKIILGAITIFFIGIFAWVAFSPKEDISERIYRTLKEQENQADMAFKQVSFEEVVAGIKYWQLIAETAMVNKSTQLSTLKISKGNFYQNGKPVLSFNSPIALWDMKKKEIFLDQPLGYDVSLKDKIEGLLAQQKAGAASIFNLPKLYAKNPGYWFQAKNLSWKLATQQLICSGNIILNKGEITGRADRLTSDVGLQNIILDGRPVLTIEPTNSSPITLEAVSFQVISPKDEIIASGAPEIRWEEANILAGKMKYLQAENILELSDRVKVNYMDIEAWGDSAQYFTEEQTIILSGKARATQGENTLAGKKVRLSLKDKKISVIGQGKVVITDEDLAK